MQPGAIIKNIVAVASSRLNFKTNSVSYEEICRTVAQDGKAQRMDKQSTSVQVYGIPDGLMAA